jgi:hypothetical protein
MPTPTSESERDQTGSTAMSRFPSHTTLFSQGSGLALVCIRELSRYRIHWHSDVQGIHFRVRHAENTAPGAFETLRIGRARYVGVLVATQP